MVEGVRKMGDSFRSKREELNLSLKEVENVTSIRMNYLQAIEEGRVEQLLSNAYALGFTKQYANFLGFDSEKLSREYPESFRFAGEKQDFAYGIGTLEMRGSPHGGVRWLPNFLWAIATAAFAIGAYFFAKFVGLF